MARSQRMSARDGRDGVREWKRSGGLESVKERMDSTHERTLYQFSISHYCEKTRWNLDAKGLTYAVKRKIWADVDH